MNPFQIRYYGGGWEHSVILQWQVTVTSHNKLRGPGLFSNSWVLTLDMLLTLEHWNLSVFVRSAEGMVEVF